MSGSRPKKARGEVRSAVLFGDTEGLPRLLSVLPERVVTGLVRAGIRPGPAAELERLAAERKLPLLVQPLHDSPDYGSFVASLRELDPDLILVDSYSMLLPDDVLEIPRAGAINLHGGLLPEFRGPNPIQWALVNNENRAGVTMHHMTAEFDAGDIIARREVPIEIDDTWLDVIQQIGIATEELLAEEIPRVLAGEAEGVPQDEGSARRFERRTPEDGRFEWSESVIAIYNLIRALVAPHPGAFYESRGERVTLDRYLTIAEVTALKYGGPGGMELRGESVLLRPTGEPSNDRLGFKLVPAGAGEPVGRALIGLSWADPSHAELELDLQAGPPDGELRSEATALLMAFVHEQLAIPDARLVE